MLTKKTLPSRFVLAGFSNDQQFRQYAFEGIEEDHSRTLFTVRADLALARAYGIHFQDLPLLCREFLERRAATEDARRLTFGEEEMRLCRAERLAAELAAAQKKRPPRRPSAENTGNAWRTTPQSIQHGS
ncbi:MAG: hypothetical protein LC114_06165 [Bryobacterales bacterium]|nr:hypothetical protein [Bryobacterales bacterium]